ncbi:MAG: ABC transporter permease [Candidatus Cloacimonetes bacterium]|nr:ABC transporter permease [Candidatus Cloacimonadota bacterium]
MLLNYLKTAFRNILRNKLYSLINILGLAIGVTACLLIMLFINYEFSFEKMFSKADRIYRVLTIDAALGTNKQRVGITMPPLGTVLAENFPEIEAATRISGGRKMLMQIGDEPGIYAKEVRAADANFLSIFDFPLLKGDAQTALAEPYSVIFTEKLAHAVFGEEEAMGKAIKVDGIEVTVTGVMPDLPGNTHFTFDALASLSTFAALARAQQRENDTRPIWLEEWQMIAMPTYMLASPNADLTGLEERITAFTREHDVEENFTITLQALKDVHLHSTDVIFDRIANKGDIKNIYIFAIIALLILIIAAVNYMNLSTACSLQRAREVGIRKVVGSLRSQLRMQFLGESLGITILAIILAIPLLELTLPFLNSISGSQIILGGLQLRLVGVSLLAICLFIGILAGLYPAFVLSRYKPVQVLMGAFKSQDKGILLRRILVIFQFTLSIALIGLTVIIQQQLHYISKKDIGYNREQVAVFEMSGRAMFNQADNFIASLREFSGFKTVGASSNIPGRTFGRTGLLPEGVPTDDIWIWSTFSVTPEFIAALDMQIVEGRNFRAGGENADENSVLINETAVQQLGWEDPVGKLIYGDSGDSVGVEVIGVVKDFHFITMHQNIEPVIIYPVTGYPGNIIAARIEKGRIEEALSYAETKWQEFFPDYPFSYIFMDDEFNTIYARDLNTGIIVKIFSFLTIFVACLGLLGLSSHAINQRRKEISIRKVLGASTGEITRLLLVNFIQWVALANVFALPLGWFVARQWLKNFAYRIEPGFLTFIISGTLAVLIAMTAIIFQTVKAANANPADSMKYE